MSENEKKLINAFCTGLSIDASIIKDDLTYNTIAEWDSIGHMKLIAEIDKTFDIMRDTEDVIDMSTFGKAKELLGKYEISF